MDESILPWIILIAACLGVIVGVTLFELRMRRKKEEASGFKIGCVYQMEDGTMAKYVGDGKFLKVREEKIDTIKGENNK